MPKNKKLRGDKVARAGPLAEQIVSIDSVKPSGRTKVRKRRTADDEFVESDLTKKILSQARMQQQELEEEYGVTTSQASLSARVTKQFKVGSASKDEDDGLEESLAAQEGMLGPVEVSAEDEKAFEAFMSKKGHRSLTETVKERLEEKRTEIETIMSDGPGSTHDISPEIVALLKKVGEILKKYRSGKLPKLFKRLPSFDKWEQCLFITQPDEWSAAAMYAATKIFASNLSAHLAQRFYSTILLPRIRDDIEHYKRLNFHLMMALKKSLFKPSAFFKGILLPLCESGDCTLREATIVSSVLREHSVPIQHAGAAIDRIATMDYNGANSIFLRTLLDKKYALAYCVIDSVDAHFVRFMNDSRQLPVLWHQSLLTFVQRYKCDLSEGQKELIYDLIKKHNHHEISLEVRRELENSPCRSDADEGSSDAVMK
ncbi:bystin-like [Littorina saxatilis]|uniref:Bystin n=1 Tax=Littorina saxatilis TaxID=31220 RepID=A0AAN9AMQ0_9CAEN